MIVLEEVRPGDEVGIRDVNGNVLRGEVVTASWSGWPALAVKAMEHEIVFAIKRDVLAMVSGLILTDHTPSMV